ncbi:GDSL-type esterase/lipase family protein [Brevundimonas sp.]|uniref:GDSL-type esterase/lipase family protein n=1 Tax=Brevundimonas sp. TaxID=1871086 RepID=UPI0035B043FB
MGRTAAALVAGLWALAGAAAAQEVPYVASTLPPPAASACPGGICQVEALADVFGALAATEAGRHAGPVHILQIGDSHTAGDRITGKVRAALQVRFGDAGRGVLPPGAPYEGFAPYQVEMTGSGWRPVLAPLVGANGFGVEGVGLTGVQTIAIEPGAELRLRPEGRDALAYMISVCGEGPGRLRVEADGEVWSERVFDEHGAERSCVYQMANGRPDEIVLRPLDGALKLHDVRLAYMSGGVTLSNLGIIGATLRDLAARDEAVAALQLANWRPSLIVLAFGTNEGFEDGLDATAYEALLRGQIARLRRLAPAASLMILGAPDALRSGVEGGCSADGMRAPPPSLAVVRDVQRRVAADTGVAFWDWHGRMGGDCSSDRLALRPESLMRGDRVHFTSAGADWIGGILADDLLAAYEAWKAAR